MIKLVGVLGSPATCLRREFDVSSIPMVRVSDMQGKVGRELTGFRAYGTSLVTNVDSKS